MSLEITQTKEKTVWIARHGERIDFINSGWKNSAKRPFDPYLSAKGITQAQQLGKRLQDADIQHIFASPFLRTIETAYQIASILDLNIKLEYGLCEWLPTKWFKEAPTYLLPQDQPQLFSRVDLCYRSFAMPTFPESWDDLISRTKKTIDHLLDHYDGDLLLVGHGASVIGLTQALVASAPKKEPPLCSLVKLTQTEDAWDLELNGDTSHLANTENPGMI